MPTSTFFNLPEEKRHRLTHAAMVEFSQKPYGEVPLSGIILAAGIPRGSFYQYFADKTDLFQYILRVIRTEMEDLIVESLERCGGDLMELPLALFDRAAAYLQEDEAETRMTLNIMRQNANVGITSPWDGTEAVRRLLERVDLSTVAVRGEKNLCVLLDLLLTSAGQAFGAAYSGRAGLGQCRAYLERKVAIIQYGAMSEQAIEEDVHAQA